MSQLTLGSAPPIDPTEHLDPDVPSPAPGPVPGPVPDPGTPDPAVPSPEPEPAPSGPDLPPGKPPIVVP